MKHVKEFNNFKSSVNENYQNANNFSKKFIMDKLSNFDNITDYTITVDESNRLVILFKSFEANKAVNSILVPYHDLSERKYWDMYVKNGNSLYYTYDFNLDESDPKSIFAVLMDRNFELIKCVLKDNREMNKVETKKYLWNTIHTII